MLIFVLRTHFFTNKMFKLENGQQCCGTAVETSPQNPKVKGSTPAGAGSGRESGEKVKNKI
jgi:hypothetical protein